MGPSTGIAKMPSNDSGEGASFFFSLNCCAHSEAICRRRYIYGQLVAEIYFLDGKSSVSKISGNVMC